MRTAKAFLFLSVFVGGCGGDAPSDASGQCRDFIGATCKRVAECSRTLTARQCAADFAQSLDCSRAVGVSPTYDRCLVEVASARCASLTGAGGDLVLPASCSGSVILDVQTRGRKTVVTTMHLH